MKQVNDVYGFDPLVIQQIGKRSQDGKPLVEHLGATRRFTGFDQLMFLPNQLHTFMLSEDVTVDTSTVIGPQAKKPLLLETPIMITGMTYGVISKQAKLALARASTLAGTSANSGEGGMNLEERDLASKYVLQYNRGGFSNTQDHLQLADMLEIKWAQGSNPGVHSVLPASKLEDDLRQIRNLPPGSDSFMPAHHTNINSVEDLKEIVSQLREISGGVPIALKFCASRIREDIDVALEVGVDVIVIDGAQGGTGASMILTENNFGIPTLHATAIAANYLQTKGVSDRVSLIMAGGFRTPGDVLKALALGADAVYMGTVCLLAMTLNQKANIQSPDEAIKMVHYNVPETALFNIDLGAQHLANYINACTEEVRRGCRLLGTTNVHQVAKEHLVSLAESVSKLTGIRHITDM